MTTSSGLAFFITSVLLSTTSAAQVNGWYLAGNRADAYTVGIDSEERHSGERSAFIECVQRTECVLGFGTLMQKFKADEYRTTRIRLSGWVRTDDAGEASLWMRVDDARSEMLAFDNMSDRKIRGFSEWRPQQIVLDVPKNSKGIFFGVSLTGVGKAWVDDVRIEVVDKRTKSTNMAEVVRANRSAAQLLTDEARAFSNRIMAELDASGFQPVNMNFEK